MNGAKEEGYPWENWGDGENRRILVVRLGSLGDIVHTIPAQQLLGHHLPQAAIHWLTEPPYEELLDNIHGISKVWLADTKSWRKKLSSLTQAPRLIKELRLERFDLAFDFQGLVKSAFLSRLSGADCVSGFSRSRLREAFASNFYSRPVEIKPGKRHQIEVNMDLVNPPRYPGSINAAIPLRVHQRARDHVDGQFERLGIDNPLLLNPGAGWPTKRWPLERFARLASLIEKDLSIPVLFTYGPGEEQLIESAQAFGKKTIKSFPSSILELAAICRRSRLMVAGDTGPMHLAVALGTPVVALIGPGYPWRTGPFNPADEVVRHEDPCPNPYKRICRDHFCMDISVERVYEAVVTRLKRSQEEEPEQEI